MNNKGLAIITGASRGIGACAAKGLAADGYQVVLIARDAAALESVASEIMAAGSAPGSVPVVMPLDVTDHELVTEKLNDLTADGKHISVLVNCAGTWIKGTLGNTAEDFQRILNMNVVSPFTILNVIAEIMKKQGSGYIFNVASRSGKYGFAGNGLYAASKFALVGLGESLYREYAPYGVKVTSLCPGWVNTEMARGAGASITPEEMIQPEDILSAIRFLLSMSKTACIRELLIESTKSFL
jgi:short-subunit dehydrogenase